jgi:hypothetical protein
MKNTVYGNTNRSNIRSLPISPKNKTESSSTLAPTDKFVPGSLPSNGIMGGPDSPCFYNGKVMTIKQAKELSGWVEPTPTNATKPTLEDYALDPKNLLK